MYESALIAGISEFRRAVDGDELPNARVMGNLIDKASHFKCKHKKCDHHINNCVGLYFSQTVAHDTSSRKVKTMRGVFGYSFTFKLRWTSLWQIIEQYFAGNPNAPSPGIGCCDRGNSRPLTPSQTISDCVAVAIPKNDPFYADKKICCQSYIRMRATLSNDCKIKYVQVTTFSIIIDNYISITNDSLMAAIVFYLG